MGKWVGSRVKNALPRELVRDNNLFVTGVVGAGKPTLRLNFYVDLEKP
jgi:hypothetical protein